MIAVHSAVHVNMGMRMKCIPGARRFRIVTTKLMPVIVDPNPAMKTDHIQ